VNLQGDRLTSHKSAAPSARPFRFGLSCSTWRSQRLPGTAIHPTEATSNVSRCTPQIRSAVKR
jgi:hypothetical protein